MNRFKKALALLSTLVLVTPIATLSVSAASSDFVIEDGVLTAPTGTGGVDVSWTSSDESVAIIDSLGTVTGVAPGTAQMTLNTSNGLSASSTVTVLAQSISLPASLSLYTGHTSALEPTLAPADMVYSLVQTWTSSDTSVATVDSAGNVTGVAPGTATITLTGSNFLTASSTVTVSNVDYASYGRIALTNYYSNLKYPSTMVVKNLEYMVYERVEPLSDARFPLGDNYLVIRSTIEAMNSLGVMVTDTYVSLFNLTEGTSRHDLVGYADWLIDTYAGQTKLDGYALKNEALQLEANVSGFTAFTADVIATLTAAVKD